MKCFDVVVVDDDEFCIRALRSSLSAHPCLSIKGEAQTASAGRKLILEHRPRLLFLDVELPTITGLELLQELRDQITWPMQVVFYSAYDKYMLDALRSAAFDYLLKPFSQEELDRVVNRFLEYDKKVQSSPIPMSSPGMLPKSSSAFMVSTVTGYKVLHLEQIGYFTYQKERKQWMAILNDQSQLLLRRNTNAGDILRYSPSFMQINQQQIINVDYLSMIHDKHCMLYPPFNHATDLCISRNFYGALQERFSML